jgi:hypothetical protein
MPSNETAVDTGDFMNYKQHGRLAARAEREKRRKEMKSRQALFIKRP